MQVTPTNALFAALSAQIQTLQQGQQSKTQGDVEGDKAPRGTKVDGTSAQTSPTVLSSTGQIESGGPAPNANLREVPSAGTGGGLGFTAPGSIIDITV